MEVWQLYAAAYARLGSKKAVAREFNVDPKSVGRSLERAKRRGDIQELIAGDQGIKAGLEATGINPEHARMGYRKIKDEGGSFNTVMWRMPQIEQDPQHLIDAIISGLSDIPAADPVEPPCRVAEDLCNVWPLFDMHLGMHAWRKETLGPDYDLKLARDDFLRTVENLLQVVPPAKVAVVIFGGDTFHADDSRSETPASKHKLDVDGRHFRVIEESLRAICRAVQRLLSYHERVVIRVMRGNHDPHSHLILTFALAEHFRGENVTVLKEPADVFMWQWGRCGIFAHHGDKIAKPVDMALKLADVCPFWSEAKHRHAYVGHLHKMEAQRVGGLNWERVEPFSPADSFGAAWVNRRQLKVDTYHRTRGRIGSMFDPIERE